jgi:hypothetical protein
MKTSLNDIAKNDSDGGGDYNTRSNYPQEFMIKTKSKHSNYRSVKPVTNRVRNSMNTD